ncbi:hypothetical protein C2G38_2157790 [Gigaspora rosea]|uniref:Uncharacterized protein n=1 Tax=Gigaspora rosea TaxID=44941 RepID=A0A397W833_9GLOM|nr:hypothetical protein C2G38_2157790 [Gigaspora rosea]
MASRKFLDVLIRDYMSVLNSGDYADVILRIGDDENFKEFRAHSIVLRTRSPYFRTALSDRWAQKQDNVIIYEKPNILPEAFEVILKYIYSGVLDLNLKIHDVKVILNILVACKELCLLELFEYMQDYLLNNMSEAMQHNFSLVQRITSQHNNTFPKLKIFAKKIIDHNPHWVFKSDDFNTLEQHILISLLQRDDLLIEEIDVWDAVVQWGIANTSSLPIIKDDWTKDDYLNLGATLEPCIAHIKFGQITSEDFFQRVAVYKDAIDQDLYDELLKYHSGAAAKSKSTIPMSQRRGVDSVLIGVKHLHLFSRWIDHKTDCIYSRNNIPYEFKLLLRGNRDGFTPQAFHDLCDEKGPTLVVAKIKNTDEIIGGYNPVSWDSSDTVLEVKNSFVFSLKENLDNSILSRSAGTISSICNSPLHGPVFRGILIFNGDFKDDCASYCNFDEATTPYEGPIRKTKDKFSVEELEVFQIIKKKL